MDPDKGYHKAKKLLKEHFGNKYRISVAYIDRALFLTSCNNAMSDLDYMEELDNVANMRAIVNKFPYKLRERWRGVAFDIQEQTSRRPKFKDLVRFINMQAKIALHPLFGDIKDSNKGQAKPPVNLTAQRKSQDNLYYVCNTHGYSNGF